MQRHAKWEITSYNTSCLLFLSPLCSGPNQSTGFGERSELPKGMGDPKLDLVPFGDSI